MFFVEDTHCVIAPPLSGYYAAKKTLHKAGFSTQGSDRHGLPLSHTDHTVIAIIRPWFTWLESMWLYHKATNVWLGPNSELSREVVGAKLKYFYGLVDLVAENPGIIEKTWSPILSAADVVVSSVGLSACLSRALGTKVARSSREQPKCLRERHQLPAWPSLQLQKITKAEVRIGNLAGGVWRKSRGWPVEVEEYREADGDLMRILAT